MDPDPDPRPISRKTVRRVVGSFRPYRGKVSLVGILIVITATLGVVNPLLIAVVFDKALFPKSDTVPPHLLPPNMDLLFWTCGVMILIPIVDPISGQTIRKFFIWDGKIWFSSQQDVDIVFIQHQEINSVLTAWGTDGFVLYRLFQRPSVDITKTLQSRFWAQPIGYHYLKTATRFWGLARYYSTDEPDITLTIDSESQSLSQTINVDDAPMTWINNSGDPIVWENNSSDTLEWVTFSPGVVVFEPEAVAGNGALLGFTITTNSADMALISSMMHALQQNYRG